MDSHKSYYGYSDSCSSCPSWYTSDEWATAKSSCYVNVSWWKYKTSKTWSSTTNCAANTYSTDHKAYYDSSDSCTSCPSWQTSSAWSTSCSTPSGWSSGWWQECVSYGSPFSIDTPEGPEPDAFCQSAWWEADWYQWNCSYANFGAWWTACECCRDL